MTKTALKVNKTAFDLTLGKLLKAAPLPLAKIAGKRKRTRTAKTAR